MEQVLEVPEHILPPVLRLDRVVQRHVPNVQVLLQLGAREPRVQEPAGEAGTFGLFRLGLRTIWETYDISGGSEALKDGLQST